MPQPRAGLPNDTYPAKNPNPGLIGLVTGLLPPDFCLYPNSIHRYRTPGLGSPGFSPAPRDGPGCSRARQGPRAPWAVSSLPRRRLRYKLNFWLSSASSLSLSLQLWLDPSDFVPADF